MNLAYAVSLLIAPGALVSFSRPGRGLSPELRLATAVALAPGVLALELAASALVGMAFQDFVRYVVPINLIGIVQMVTTRYHRDLVVRAIPVALVAAVLLLPLLPAYSELWYVRQYGWHNMMHLSTIEQIYRLPRMPEEMDLAGLRLHYPWLGYAQAAILSAIADRPAITWTILINPLQCLALFTFLCAAVQQLRPLTRWRASLVTGLALLSPGLLDVARMKVTTATFWAGELRITPPTEKYINFDPMVYGMTSVAMLTYVVTRCLSEDQRRLMPLLPIALFSCALCYPMMFPACLAICGVFVLTVLAARSFPQLRIASYSPAALVPLVASMVAVTAMFAIYLAVIGTSATTSPARLVHRWELETHLVQIVFVFGPVLAVFLAMFHRWLRGGGAYLALVVAFGLLLFCYAMLAMPLGTEYKFLFAALFVGVPALACAIDAATPRHRLSGLALAASHLAVNAVAFRVIINWLVPPARLSAAAPLDETSRFVRPTSGWDQNWMKAVRESTPRDTVVITGDTLDPVSVFTERSLFVVADWSDGGGAENAVKGRGGYLMDRQTLLEDVKGYSKSEIADRVRILRLCLSGEAEQRLTECLERLKEMRRPVALHIVQPSALADLLRRDGIGRRIFERGVESVWLMSPEELAATATRVARQNPSPVV